MIHFSKSDSLTKGDDEGRLVIAEDEAEDVPSTPKKPEVGQKPRRKHNRFNGMSEDEVAKMLLPDLIKEKLDILIVSVIVTLIKITCTCSHISF